MPNNERPFEWLTSPSSLDPYVKEALGNGKTKARVLHVGCGSSTWSEHVLDRFGCDLAVNIDKDGATLDKAQRRWNQHSSYGDNERLQFRIFDFLTDRMDPQFGPFDLILDKSTLDCTLCSDQTSAALLSMVYMNLNPDGGAYLLVSFHNKGLLKPLLEDLPGAHWTVEHWLAERQVEDLITNSKDRTTASLLQTNATEKNHLLSEGTAWTCDGKFDPDEKYRRTVNVFLCRRQALGDEALDPSLVAKHVENVSDAWYKLQNPILTDHRRSTLEESFKSFRLLDLPSAYQILFTDDERDHLEYEDFLDDWKAFAEIHRDQTDTPSAQEGVVTLDLALDFLAEMQ